MKYTKARIKAARQGIRFGEIITKEHEDLLQALGIEMPNIEGPSKARIVNNKIDAALRKITIKRKSNAVLQVDKNTTSRQSIQPVHTSARR